MHKLIAKNKKGRDFVVGDIHGRYDLLKVEMKAQGFDKKSDRLFSVGDIINRGPDSLKCLNLLKKKWFFMVLGNHEEMMVDAVKSDDLKTWCQNNGKWLGRIPRKDQKKWAKILSKQPVSLTVKSNNYRVGICHAEPDGTSWRKTRDRQKSRATMLWGRRVLRNRKRTKVKGVDFTVHGHTPLDSARWLGNRYFLDTGAWYSDNLTFRALDEIFSEYQQRSKK